MVAYVATFKWKDEVSEDAVDTALRQIVALHTKVAGIRDIYAGKNYSRRPFGHTHSVMVVAQNQTALNNYRNHPDYNIVASLQENIKEETKEFAVDASIASPMSARA